MGNCLKKSSVRKRSDSEESVDSKEPLNKKGDYVIQHRSATYQNTYVNFGVNGWSGRGIRCDGLDGYCDGRGTDCAGRRESLHPNAFNDHGRREKAVGAASGFAAVAGGAVLTGRLFGDDEEHEIGGGGGRGKADVGPRDSVRTTGAGGDDHVACEPSQEGVCAFDH